MTVLKLKNGKGEKSSIRFIEFARIYYKEYAEKELSPTTVQGGKTELRNYVLPEIANMPLNKIDALTIQRIINKLKERDRERLDKNGNVENYDTKIDGITKKAWLQAIIDKLVKKNIIHKNNGDRKKSKFMWMIKKLETK